MWIIRNALVKLSDAKNGKVKPWVTSYENAEIFTGYHQFFEEDILYVLITSIVKLGNYPNLDENNSIKFPFKEISIAEKNIEKEASLLSVQTKSVREIFSPIPYFLFVYRTPEELDWLNNTSGYMISGEPTVSEYFSVHECQDVSPTLLADRASGVTLLSEALCHKNYMGKYRDYMRFFELAFSRKISQLSKKLYQILQGFSEANYTKQEVEEWIKHRNPSSHANQGAFTTERSVKPYIQRIEQAAYDILYNKKDWNSYSKERRNIYFPSFFTISKDGKSGARPGTRITFSCHSNDEFQSYKMKNYHIQIKFLNGLHIWGENYNRPFGRVTSKNNRELNSQEDKSERVTKSITICSKLN